MVLGDSALDTSGRKAERLLEIYVNSSKGELFFLSGLMGSNVLNRLPVYKLAGLHEE
jgi:hypothetical protein